MSYLMPDYNNMTKEETKKYEASLKFFYISMFISIFVFYIVPFICLYTVGGNLGENLAGLALMSMFPIFVFIVCFIYTRKYGMQITIPIALGLSYFMAAIVVYKKLGAAIFALAFFIIGLFGEFTGYLMNRRAKSKREPIGVARLRKVAEKQAEREARKAGKAPAVKSQAGKGSTAGSKKSTGKTANNKTANKKR